MASITLKKVPDEVLQRLRERSRQQRRSLNQEILYILERALATTESPVQEASLQVAAWRSLSGLWVAKDTVRSEIRQLYKSRSKGRKVDL